MGKKKEKVGFLSWSTSCKLLILRACQIHRGQWKAKPKVLLQNFKIMWKTPQNTELNIFIPYMYTKICLHVAGKILTKVYLNDNAWKMLCVVFCTTLSVSVSKTAPSYRVKIVKEEIYSLLEKHLIPCENRSSKQWKGS